MSETFSKCDPTTVMWAAERVEQARRAAKQVKDPMNRGEYGQAADDLEHAIGLLREALLEQNLPDIAEPDGASILEAAQVLEAKRTIVFKKATNLTSGVTQFQYEEADQGKGGGDVKLPRQFTLAIPPYEHDEPVFVVARLRYRIADEGKLTLSYVLERPHKAVEKAFAAVLDRVHAATEIPPLLGAVTV